MNMVRIEGTMKAAASPWWSTRKAPPIPVMVYLNIEQIVSLVIVEGKGEVQLSSGTKLSVREEILAQLTALCESWMQESPSCFNTRNQGE